MENHIMSLINSQFFVQNLWGTVNYLQDNRSAKNNFHDAFVNPIIAGIKSPDLVQGLRGVC